MEVQNENVWNIKSLYDLQLFTCPACPFSEKSKQIFVNHAYVNHIECKPYLENLTDNSLKDVALPWDSWEGIDISAIDNGEVESEEDYNFEQDIEIKHQFVEQLENEMNADENSLKEEPEKNTFDDKQELMNEGQLITNSLEIEKADYDGEGMEDSDNEIEDESDENTQNTIAMKPSPPRPNPPSVEQPQCPPNLGRSSRRKQSLQPKRIDDFDLKDSSIEICDVCNKEFKSSDGVAKSLKDRLRGHMLESHLRCKRCRKVAATVKDLEKHKKTCDTTHPCNRCDSVLSSRIGLLDHIKCVHENIRNHQCEKCDRKFHEPGTLRKHVQSVHEGIKRSVVKKHPCEHCGTLFVSQGQLSKHVKIIHFGEKDFPCQFCDKTFAYATSLELHLSARHDGPRFPCNQCDKTFTSQGHLRTHIQCIHENVKNHVCTQCGKEFFYPGNFRAHVRTVHEGRRDHKCEFCEKAFVRVQYLDKHIASVHPNMKKE